MNPKKLRGASFEQLIFGVSSKGVKPDFLNYRLSVIDVVMSQAELKNDPRKPRSGITLYLFKKIQEQLPTKKLKSELKFYVSIGRSLDWWHGIDGFFELNGVIATIDVTCNSSKKQFYAHFLFTKEIKDSTEKLDAFAKQIAIHLLTSSDKILR